MIAAFSGTFLDFFSIVQLIINKKTKFDKNLTTAADDVIATFSVAPRRGRGDPEGVL